MKYHLLRERLSSFNVLQSSGCVAVRFCAFLCVAVRCCALQSTYLMLISLFDVTSGSCIVLVSLTYYSTDQLSVSTYIMLVRHSHTIRNACQFVTFIVLVSWYDVVCDQSNGIHLSFKIPSGNGKRASKCRSEG